MVQEEGEQAHGGQQPLRRRLAVGTALAVVGLAPAAAEAQYRRHRQTPVSRTSSTAARQARTRRSTSGSSPPARSRSRTGTASAAEGGQGQATLDPVEGSFLVGASPFGAYWYPVKTFGDAVFRIQFTVQNTPTSTRNGGVMIRSPEIRYSCPDATDRRRASSARRTNNDAAMLALKPTGFNFDLCPGAIPLCGADGARGVDDVQLGRRLRAVPAARHLRRRLLRAPERGRRAHRRRPESQRPQRQRR